MKWITIRNFFRQKQILREELAAVRAKLDDTQAELGPCFILLLQKIKAIKLLKEEVRVLETQNQQLREELRKREEDGRPSAP